MQRDARMAAGVKPGDCGDRPTVRLEHDLCHHQSGPFQLYGLRKALSDRCVLGVPEKPGSAGETPRIFDHRWASGASEQANQGMTRGACRSNTDLLSSRLQPRTQSGRIAEPRRQVKRGRATKGAKRDQLVKNVSGYLRSHQRQPHIVQSYFDEEFVRYAAT